MAKTIDKFANDYIAFGQSFISNKAHTPIIGNETFSSLSDLIDFVQNDAKCSEGSLLKVINTTNESENGVFFVEKYGTDYKLTPVINSGNTVPSGYTIGDDLAIKNLSADTIVLSGKNISTVISDSVSGKQNTLKRYNEDTQSATIEAQTFNVKVQKVALSGDTFVYNGKEVATTDMLSGMSDYVTTTQLSSAFAASATTDYNKLTDKPKINGIVLSGDVSSTELGIVGSDATVTKDITILGTNAGVLEGGSVIPSGTSLTELLELLFVKEIDPTAVLPVLNGNWVVSGTFETINGVKCGEVGDNVISFQIVPNGTVGMFTGSSVDFGGTGYSISADCKMVSCSYRKRGFGISLIKVDGPVSNNELLSLSGLSLALGNNSVEIWGTYSNSSVTPKTNKGNDSTVSIPSGFTVSKKIAVNGYYKYFFGTYTSDSILTSSAITSNSSDATVLKSGLISASGTNSTFKIIDSSYTPEGFKIFLAIPSAYTISTAKGSLGADWLLADNHVSMSYKNGKTTTDYTVYYYAGEAAQEITSLIIKKS